MSHFEKLIQERKNYSELEDWLSDIDNDYLRLYLSYNPLKFWVYAWHELDNLLKRCESPIEMIMCIALLDSSDDYDLITFNLFEKKFEEKQEPSAAEELVIYPQASIGSYRVDFRLKYLMYCKSGHYVQELIIECDGHEFHETKEAAAKDKKRDRFLKKEGFDVLRFTGSEIYKNPFGCVDEISELFKKNSMKWWRAKMKK